MSFTEFYIQASGADTNSGSTTGNSAVYTATNGAWDKDSGANEGTFTPASGDPSATVSADMFGSIYADGGSVAVAVMRVKSVTSTTIVFDQAKFAGSIPADAANGMTVKVGGAWATPAFGIPFMTSTLQNNAGDTPRCNIKNATYTTSAVITQANAGPIRFEHYATSAGDGTSAARAIIDGNGGNYNIIAATGANCDWVGLEAMNNATGNLYGFYVTGAEIALIRCVAHDITRSGFYCSSAGLYMEQCEAYSCNELNATNWGGIHIAGRSVIVRCTSHDNIGSNAIGFIASSMVVFDACIADSNGSDGFNLSGSEVSVMLQCDAYNNAGDGVELSSASAASYILENCNLVKNGGWGINGSGAGTRNGCVVNCGFGSGTQANTSGTVTGLKSMTETGTVTHTANETPWVDPGDGDFRITLSTAKNAGRGAFTQTQAGYGDPNATVAYNDIGAARHADPAGGGGGGPLIGGRLVQ